jgi:hypothetical protein
MKKLASIFLFLFVLFLISPTVVSAIENDSSISIVCDFSEEEQVQKDIKLVFYFEQIPNRLFLPLVISKLVSSENTLNHKDISLGIFIPPPELG